MDFENVYDKRFKVLELTAKRIESEIASVLKGIKRVDGITSRAKSVESFIEKAGRIENNSPKYSYPLEEILDQIGVRVIVLYLTDAEIVTGKLLKHFTEIENMKKEETDPARFGYESRHCICVIPPDIRLENNCSIKFFELQVCTVFQHAWAAANHDLGYKANSVNHES